MPLTSEARGQTVTTVTDADVRNTPAVAVADIVRLAPGVAVIQGNGPRDVGVPIRGSNARQRFGARNIQVSEDDFPVDRPDGPARFDPTDPHAYGAADVVRGAVVRALGAYALDGVVNFRTRRGRDVNGAEVGIDFGGDGFADIFATIGGAGGDHDQAVLGGLVGAEGATAHTDHRTATLNALGACAPSPSDRVTGEFIHDRGEFRLSTRLSLDQYRLNPQRRGCGRARKRDTAASRRCSFAER